MPDTGTGRAYGRGELSTRTPGTPIVLPMPGRVDDVGVSTGFPHTVPGAMAQLVAIDTRALEAGSLPVARVVIHQWAAPGGPTASSWSVVRSLARLLDSAGVSGAGSSGLTIALTPAMGFVKGTLGQDFSVVCIDVSIDITVDGYTSTNAVVDCQRMLWTGARWVIGPGTEPAAAPSVWPDSDAAIDAGYRDLITPAATPRS